MELELFFSEAQADLFLERTGFRELPGAARVWMIRAHGTLQILQRRAECGASLVGFALCLESAAKGEKGVAQFAGNSPLLDTGLQQRHSSSSIGRRLIRVPGF